MLKEIGQIRFWARFPARLSLPPRRQLQQELAMHVADILAGVHGVRVAR